MRARTFALAALLALLATAAGGQELEFKQFASGDGRYKVQFPGTVKTATTDVPAGKDTLKLTLDAVELKGGITFMVSYVDASEEVAKKPAGPRFDKIRDAVKGEKGSVVSEKDAEAALGEEKFPAREVLLETPNGFIRNRMVIAGRRLYQVMVQGSKEAVTSPSADKFLGSFEITK